MNRPLFGIRICNKAASKSCGGSKELDRVGIISTCSRTSCRGACSYHSPGIYYMKGISS